MKNRCQRMVRSGNFDDLETALQFAEAVAYKDGKNFYVNRTKDWKYHTSSFPACASAVARISGVTGRVKKLRATRLAESMRIDRFMRGDVNQFSDVRTWPKRSERHRKRKTKHRRSR